LGEKFVQDVVHTVTLWPPCRAIGAILTQRCGETKRKTVAPRVTMDRVDGMDFVDEL
jgi:hypothetical protein